MSVVAADGERTADPPGRLIRHVLPSDEERLWHFLSGLSERSRYMRFFRYHTKLDVEARALATCEQDGGIGLVAVEARGEIVAHAHLFQSDDGLLEMGIAVADDHQHQGLGGELLESLGHAAREQSILAYRAVVLSSNGPMLRLLGSIGSVIADCDTDFFDLLVGTGGAMPSWPRPRGGRPRVLVEGRGWYSSAESDILTSLGCEILRCTGRLPAHICPLISGGSCPLVDGADLVVVAFRSGDPNRAVLEQHLSRPGCAPVLVEAEHGTGMGELTVVPNPVKDKQKFVDTVSRILTAQTGR